MKKTPRGFTVIEVTIAAAVSTIIMLGAFTLLHSSNKQLSIMHAKMTIQENPREALFKMAQEIRQTSPRQISNFGTNGSSIQFRVPVPEPDASTLINPTFDPLWAADITYALNPNTRQIVRTSNVAGVITTTVLANNITALAFSRSSVTSPLIRIRIDAQQVLSDGRTVPAQPIQLVTEAEARNP